MHFDRKNHFLQASAEVSSLLENRQPDCDHYRSLQPCRLQPEEGLLPAGHHGCWWTWGEHYALMKWPKWRQSSLGLCDLLVSNCHIKLILQSKNMFIYQISGANYKHCHLRARSMRLNCGVQRTARELNMELENNLFSPNLAISLPSRPGRWICDVAKFTYKHSMIIIYYLTYSWNW